MKSLEISHYQSMTHRLVEELSDKLHYSIDRLGRVARAGGFITDETTEAIQLEADAIALRSLADALMQRRAALLANEQHQQIAAE